VWKEAQTATRTVEKVKNLYRIVVHYRKVDSIMRYEKARPSVNIYLPLFIVFNKLLRL
jgi:hypothetical protein